MSRPGIVAIILTKDEENNLPACLESLRGVVSVVYVVDSGSRDATVRIADSFGARVLHHDFVTQARQFNWALDHIQSESEWVMRVDADERVSPKLGKSLAGILPTLSESVTGLEVPIRIRFLGRDLRWGDSYPVWLIRLFRSGKGRYDDAWMDERIVLSEGRVKRITGDLIHEIPKNLTDWTVKHSRYSERECRELLEGRIVDRSAGRRKILKQSLYLRLPCFVRAFLYWFYRYFLCLGFLDGREGLIYHFLHAFWYRFLVDSKLYELKR